MLGLADTEANAAENDIKIAMNKNAFSQYGSFVDRRKWSLWHYAGAAVFAVMTGGAGLAVGYQTGFAEAEDPTKRAAVAIEAIFDQEKSELAEVQAEAREHMDALALRLGQLQARVLRLDALGERLTAIGKLDKGEFDFSIAPAIGGPDSSGSSGEEVPVSELVSDLEQLTQRLYDRETKLTLLEDLLMNRKLAKEMRPSGRPIKKGWVSSYFGKRKDPFTGRKKMHKGMDFAGKENSDVIAVASGLVTYASERSAYGWLVEIQHGQGYATRYGHNKAVTVEVGDRVYQGQVIAKLGTTGRSTGPHVHFEVLRSGHPVNPQKYIQASR